MSGRNWTIYQLEILFHRHCSPAPFDRHTAPLYAPTLTDLYSDGLLQSVDGITRTTERGAAFVELLLQTPLPQQVWLDPRSGKEVILEYSAHAAKKSTNTTS